MELKLLLERAGILITSNNWDLPPPERISDLRNRYHGPDKLIREKIKVFARDLCQNENECNKILGYILEAYAHFYRSQENALNQKRKHPEKFVDYFAHWIYSDLDYFPKNIQAIFKNNISCPSKINIGKGKSYFIVRRK